MVFLFSIKILINIMLRKQPNFCSFIKVNPASYVPVGRKVPDGGVSSQVL